MDLVCSLKHYFDSYFNLNVADFKEEGDYLALDLGGTNFRVIFLRIKAGKLESEEVQVLFF